MARTRDRVFALVIVITFTLTTVGIGIASVWQASNEEKKRDQQMAKQLKGKDMQDFTPVATVEELQIIDLEPGKGSEVKAGDTVTVDYTGALAATGKVFESSLDSGQPVTFGLDQVIKGWGEGLVGVKEGGKRRLIIPAELAYGPSSPSPDIPANSDLVFDVIVHSVQKK